MHYHLQHDHIILCVQIADVEYDAMRNTRSSTTAEVNTLTVTTAELNMQLEAATAQHEVQCAELVLQCDTTTAEIQSDMQTINTLQVIICYNVAHKSNTLQQQYIAFALLGHVKVTCCQCATLSGTMLSLH
jgi:ABC-type Fe2+-enterobactin transport system substrate-binding protein